MRTSAWASSGPGTTHMANEIVEADKPRSSSQDRLLAMIRNKYPEYHPVVSMVEIAQTTEDEALEFQCHKEVAKYVVQVDKFTEVKTEVRKTQRVIVELFGGPDRPDRRAPVLEANASGVLEPPVAQPEGVAQGVRHTEVGSDVTRTTVVHERGPVVDLWGDGSDASDVASRFA